MGCYGPCREMQSTFNGPINLRYKHQGGMCLQACLSVESYAHEGTPRNDADISKHHARMDHTHPNTFH